jgi:predicted  nucleic acid-binding Zn-ribbon protein
MTTGIIEPRAEGERPTTPASSSPPAFTPPAPRWGLIVLSAVVVLLGVYSVWGIQSSRSTLGTQGAAISDLSTKLDSAATENATLKSQLADTKSQLDGAAKRLDEADQAADRARALALRNRAVAERSAKQLGGAIDEQRTQLGALGGTVDGVKTNVTANRTDIDRALGGLSEQNGLIARTREELDALKRLGGREYAEFDLRKSKEFTRIGPLSVRLNKTDEKRQRYTVTLVVNDKQVEKKDIALFEPLQFYIPGTRSVMELVAQEIQDGRIVGYVSSPKETVPRS